VAKQDTSSTQENAAGIARQRKQMSKPALMDIRAGRSEPHRKNQELLANVLRKHGHFEKSNRSAFSSTAAPCLRVVKALAADGIEAKLVFKEIAPDSPLPEFNVSVAVATPSLSTIR
jgi:hypothetical protein